MAFTLERLYEFFVDKGMENDPRGREAGEKKIKQSQEKFEELGEDEKEFFDKNSLNNPYSDTRILHGDKETSVRKVLVGIDIGVGEILLADRLREKGEEIDAVISHHPEGSALARLYDVMDLQIDLLHDTGVPVAVAEKLMKKRIKEVERGILPANHFQSVDAAKRLDIPFMCVHTPADNSVTSYIEDKIEEKSPSKVEDIIDLLLEEPEYKLSKKNDTGPKVVVGSEDSRTGNVYVDMTGGTSGSKEIYEHLAEKNIGTIVGMHMKKEYRENAKENHVNVVIAAHDLSDALGLNLLIDSVQEEQSFETVECSGFRRFKRN